MFRTGSAPHPQTRRIWVGDRDNLGSHKEPGGCSRRSARPAANLYCSVVSGEKTPHWGPFLIPPTTTAPDLNPDRTGLRQSLKPLDAHRSHPARREHALGLPSVNIPRPALTPDECRQLTSRTEDMLPSKPENALRVRVKPPSRPEPEGPPRRVKFHGRQLPAYRFRLLCGDEDPGGELMKSGSEPRCHNRRASTTDHPPDWKPCGYTSIED